MIPPRDRQALCLLWLHVIRQAIEDATDGSSDRIRNEAQRAPIREEAREWLLKPNRDFEEACTLAELDAIKVRACAAEIIERADRARAAGIKRTRGRPVELNGETMNIAQWAKHLGIPSNIIAVRLRAGWSLQQIIIASYTPRSKRKLEPRHSDGEQIPRRSKDEACR